MIEADGIDNLHITSMEPIISPMALKEQIPNSNEALVAKTRREIGDILHGRDSERLFMVVGPCSIHDIEAAVDYSQRLGRLRVELEDEFVIVMRTYPEKPRTTVGWTGLSYIPDLEGTSDPSAGITVTRQLLAAINNSGVPCAVEVLDPFTPQSIADLVSWAAIGARTVESQTHRQLASGLSMPVGFKNTTEGDVKIAIDAVVTANNPHTFYGINSEGRVASVRTSGNPDTHIVLRGGTRGTNYDEASIVDAARSLRDRTALNESSRPVMIDCSHGNSNKDHRNQPIVIEDVLHQAQSRPYLMGFMVESNIYEGRQDWVPGRELNYGVSITDACIGWGQTEHLLRESARAMRQKIYLSALPE